MALNLKLSPRSTLKFKTQTKIPAQLIGGDGIDVAYANGAYTISTDLTSDWSFTGSVSITGTNTTDRGLTITQSSPTSGSIVGPLIYNYIDVASGNSVTNDGSGPFTPPDPLLSQAHRALEVRLTPQGGANTSGFQEALVAQVLHTQANSSVAGIEYIALVTMAYADKTVPLVNNGGGLYSVNANTFIGSGGSVETAIGANIEAGIFTGGAANRRMGLLLQSHGNVHGSENDTAIDVWADLGDISWEHFVTFSDPGRSEAQSIATTGSLFKSLQAMTVANVFDMATQAVTVTGNILDFPNVQLTGSGNLTLTSTDGGALSGPTITLHRNSSTPAANDIIGALDFSGKDSAGNTQFYARIQGFINDPTSTSEDSSILFQTEVAGTADTRLSIGGGIQIVGAGAPTGGDPGVGYINAAGGYLVNNVAVPTASNHLGFFAATTSAQLAGVISDETGSGALVFGTSPTFTTSITITSTDGGAGPGTQIVLYHNSATPAVNDILGAVDFQGNDSGAALQSYGRILSLILDPTAGSEDGAVNIQTVVNGGQTFQAGFADGAQIGAATGGYKGNGTLNTSGQIYINNVGVISGALGSTDNLALRADGVGGLTAQGSALVIADTTGALSRSGGGGVPIQGTNTNDSAAAGNIGERVVSAVEPGSAVSITTATDTNLTSISLTAGDWIVTGKISFLPASGTASTLQQASLSTTSATREVTAARLSNAWNGPSTADVALSAVVQPTQFLLNATTTIYLVARANFTVSTMTMYGIIEARRIR